MSAFKSILKVNLHSFLFLFTHYPPDPARELERRAEIQNILDELKKSRAESEKIHAELKKVHAEFKKVHAEVDQFKRDVLVMLLW
jgi:F0F1-type ATP synthase membrane subunit b/b'